MLAVEVVDQIPTLQHRLLAVLAVAGTAVKAQRLAAQARPILAAAVVVGVTLMLAMQAALASSSSNTPSPSNLS